MSLSVPPVSAVLKLAVVIAVADCETQLLMLVQQVLDQLSHLPKLPFPYLLCQWSIANTHGLSLEMNISMSAAAGSWQESTSETAPTPCLHHAPSCKVAI